MKITKTKVYNLEEAITSSGLPMSTTDIDKELNEKDYDRAMHLGKAKQSSGNDCYLKGIIVTTDIKAPEYWWPQFQRYHFADIVSSQSKMHKLTKMDLDDQCNEYVYPVIKNLVKDLVRQYNSKPTQENFQILMSNVPMGLELKANIVTNYLQLKTIYYQRHTHKLEEWHYFCNWCTELPKFGELTGLEKKLEEK